MFKSIELENFKAFGDRTLIEFAPITLIFGQNSAGKSSILQALSLLKQTRESREVGAPLLPRAEGGITDLGSFQEMLFDHDLSKTLSIGLQIDTKRTRYPSNFLGRWFGKRSPESMGLSLHFKRPKPDDEVQISGFNIDWPKLDIPLASFGPRTITREESRSVDRYYRNRPRGRHRSRQHKLRAAVCTHLSDSNILWEGIHAKWLEHSDSITEVLKSLSEDITSTGPPFIVAEDIVEDSEDVEKESARWNNSLQAALRFYSKTFTLDQFVRRMTSAAQSAVVAMDGFIPLPMFRRVVTAPELHALSFRRAQLHNKIPLFDISHIAPFVGRIVEDALEALFPMGPFRRPPERWYIFTGASPDDVGYRGDLLPDFLFRRPDLIKDANAWLDRLDIGYALRVRSIGEEGSDLFEVRLVDSRRSKEVDVALSDVGFGISQILPFIVQTLASNRQVISIEQPEVHLHPKLQADLGDLLATAIGEPYEHQFLVETHSEHLVLRLQKLVREGQLRPEDISVIFVSRGAGGSEARRLRLDDDGRFMDEWPGGFFEERLSEFV